MSEIGELLEEPGQVRGVWRIPGILTLLGEDKAYFSPDFLFFDSRWSLYIYFATKGWIGLFLWINNSDSPKEVSFSFKIKTASGKKEGCRRGWQTFSQDGKSYWGESKFLKVSDLQRRGTELAPSGVLTICYTLESVGQRPSEVSLVSLLWNMSRSFMNILYTEERCDVTLNLKNGKLSAHRMILGSRSPVFDRMFGVDLRDSQTDKVNIKDATEGAFRVVLAHAYGGDPCGLSCENVCEVYKIAHKYEFQDLRKFCVKFMRETLCVDTVCDVIEVAQLYQEEALKVCVKDFFVKHKTEVFKSEKWKSFKKVKPSVYCEVLEWIVGEEI